MHKVLVIAGKDLTAGFALAGVETLVAEDPLVAGELLSDAVNSGQYAVVIIDEELADNLASEARKYLSRFTVPLVISIPGQMRFRDVESLPEDTHVANLVRQAVGYKLNI